MRKFIFAKKWGCHSGKLIPYFSQIFRSKKFLPLEYISLVFELVLAENTKLISEIYSFYPMPGDKLPVWSRILLNMAVVKLWLHKKIVIGNTVLKRKVLTFVSRYLTSGYFFKRNNFLKKWSSLENYTSNITRQHDTTWVQHEATQHNTNAEQHNTRQHK